MFDTALQKCWLRIAATVVAVSSDVLHCAADMLAAPFWEGQAHDCQTGGVTTVATSFDNSYLLSAAHDGTLYVHVSRQRLPASVALKFAGHCRV